MAQDYYATLGLAKSATKEDIKKAYRKLAAKHHPDTGGDEAEFKKINEAYSVLSDDQKKSNYDNYGSAEGPVRGFSASGARPWPNPFGDFFSGSFNQEDLFSNFFKRAYQTQTQEKARRNLTINIRYNVDFFDAINGVEKEIKFSRDEICSTCNGQGGSDMKVCPVCNGSGSTQMRHGPMVVNQTCNRCHGAGSIIQNKCEKCDGKKYIKTTKVINIKIPPGTKDGDRLRIKQQGHQSKNAFGDLIISIHVKSHEYFERHDNDILVVIPLKITQILLGSTITVPTIHGKANLKIKPGTQPGAKGDFILRMKGMGVNGGDQIVIGKLDIPKELTEKEKELIEQLEDLWQTKKDPDPIRIKDL